MKAQHFFALFLLITLVACNADFVQPTDLQNTDVLTKERMSVPADQRSPCLDLAIEYWLYATGEFQPVHAVAPLEGQPNQPSGHYQIEAYGDAVSKQFARGVTYLSMKYNPVSNTVIADMRTEFYYGQIMEVHIEGPADVRYAGQVRYLSAEIDTATFRSGEIEYELSTGDILFTLPRTPSGSFIMQVTENSTFCIL